MFKALSLLLSATTAPCLLILPSKTAYMQVDNISVHIYCSAFHVLVCFVCNVAGQSVPHIHVHILPRKPADFANSDDVYSHLEQQRLGEALIIPEDRRPRSFEEMEAEALVLRTLFPCNVPGSTM